MSAGGKRILFYPSFATRNIQHATEFRKLAVDRGDRARDFEIRLAVVFKRPLVASEIATCRLLQSCGSVTPNIAIRETFADDAYQSSP